METLSKARIKLIQSLHHKKFRLKYDKFIVEGLKISRELLEEKRIAIEEVYVSNPDYVEILTAANPGIPLHLILPQEMHQISQMTTPPGVLAIGTLPREVFLPDNLSAYKSFYLDSVRDPGNLGTILRIADWFALDYVLLSPDSVDVFNHKVMQASMGSVFRVKICTVTKDELLQLAEGQLYSCDTTGTSIRAAQPPQQGIIVLGNESLGVSGEFMHQVRDVYTIPGAASGGAESLNVATAAAIIAYWWKHE